MKKLSIFLLIGWLFLITVTQQQIIQAERTNTMTILTQGSTIDNLTLDVADLKRESKEKRRVEPLHITPKPSIPSVPIPSVSNPIDLPLPQLPKVFMGYPLCYNLIYWNPFNPWCPITKI